MLKQTVLGILSFSLVFCLTVGVAVADPSTAQNDFGVYEMVIENAQGSLDAIAQAISASAAEAGWTALATFDASASKDCSYGAKIVVLAETTYAGQVMKADSQTGPYAIVDRVNVFQDEAGTHVCVVNPRSISRTVLMDDESFAPSAEVHLQALRALITSSVEGKVSHRQLGQMRSKGFIGKTMGVVAGGKFADLLKEKASIKNGDLAAVSEAVAKSLQAESKKWGLHLVYQLDLPGHDTVLLGVTGAAMESKSFGIVGSGADESRKEYACPGLADAGAYPLEVVVYRDGDAVKVGIVDAMFRMKMYFEDAGKWAFMNNMKMPGSIDKELKKQIKNGLKSL